MSVTAAHLLMSMTVALAWQASISNGGQVCCCWALRDLRQRDPAASDQDLRYARDQVAS